MFIAFADISKAYDTVLHQGLMYFLKRLGIKGKILKSIESCYQNISSFVRVNNCNSKCFGIKRGVRQGGVLSSFLYLVYINDVFNQLETHKLGTSVCSIYSGNTALADDIALIAISPNLLQKMLNILNAYAKQWKFDLIKTKIIVLISNKKRTINDQYNLYLGNEQLRIVDVAEYVRIPITSQMRCKPNV